MVYETIRDAINTHMIEPGSRVTEAGLAQQLNVSKTPVREALMKLRQVGLVEPIGRRGGRVLVPSRAAIQQAYETREALEIYAAELVAERGSAADISAISEAARRSLAAAEAGDVAGFDEWDITFHGKISEATGNTRLRELANDTFELVTALRRQEAPLAHESVACAQAHVRIAEAIAQRDPELARRAVRAHVREVEGRALASLAIDQLAVAAAS